MRFSCEYLCGEPRGLSVQPPVKRGTQADKQHYTGRAQPQIK